MLIGSLCDDDKGINTGSVYTYSSNAGNTWSLQNKLLATDGLQDDYFGYSVTIDSTTAFVCASGDDDSAINSGFEYFSEYICMSIHPK
jgi:hypothetical protein